MAEYIVEYPDDLIAEGYVEACINVHERIVRCRDCIYNASPNEGKHFGICMKLNDSIVTANGYCSWGVRKEE